MKYRVVVDPDLCIGAASCVTVDPSHFALNDENKAVVLESATMEGERTYERTLELDDAGKDNLILAAQSCPTLAIFVYDENGKQIFPE
jgi:ferredoxin